MKKIIHTGLLFGLFFANSSNHCMKPPQRFNDNEIILRLLEIELYDNEIVIFDKTDDYREKYGFFCKKQKSHIKTNWTLKSSITHYTIQKSYLIKKKTGKDVYSINPSTGYCPILILFSSNKDWEQLKDIVFDRKPGKIPKFIAFDTQLTKESFFENKPKKFRLIRRNGRYKLIPELPFQYIR